MRVAVIVVGAAAAAMGIVVNSVYGLWFLCADLVYVILFPQLFCAIYIPFTNAYGSLFGYAVGWTLRFLGGEVLLGLEPTIFYPWYDEESGYQLFPFKTLTMLVSFVTILLFSALFQCLCMPCRRVDKCLFAVWTDKDGDVPRVGSQRRAIGSPNRAYEGDNEWEYKDTKGDF